MWDFFKTVRHRHSVHRYQSDMPVEEEKLAAILEISCAAPTAGGIQAYCIHCVESAATLEALDAACEQSDSLGGAPVVLCFSADRQRAAKQFGERGGTLFAIQDATIAAAYAQLAVTASGLDSNWVGSFDEQAVREALQLPDNLQPIALITVGYPAENPPASPRRPIQEVVVRL